MRVYLPATLPLLRHLLEPAGLEPPLTAFAVTPGFRGWYVDDDEEELEYAAMLEAARGSLRLLDSDPDAPRLRAVVALDAADSAVEIRDDIDHGVVYLSTAVTLDRVASVHVDDADASEVIATAAESIIAADLGDPAAQEHVDDAEGFELSWYASQEIAVLLDTDSD